MIALPRSFWFLFAVQFISALSDNIYRNALLIFVTFVLLAGQENSVPIVSLASALFILPFFLFSGMAGRWADRSHQDRAVRTLKAIEIPLMAVAMMALASGAIPIILGALFLLGTQAAFFGPLKYSLLPRLLPSSSLTVGNGYVEAATFIAILIGTILGGVLIVLPQGIIYVGVLLGTLAIGAYILSHFLPDVPPEKIRSPQRPWDIIRGKSSLQRSIIGISWLWFVGSAFLTLLPAFVSVTLQAVPAVATFLMTVFSVGVATGALLAAYLCKRLAPRTVITAGLAGLCLAATMILPLVTLVSLPLRAETLLTWLLTPGGIAVCGLMLGLAVCAGVFSVPLYTALQRESPDQMRAGIVAANNVVNAGLMVASAGLIMAANALSLNPPQIFAVVGLLGLPVLFLLRRAGKLI
ncbi:MAG: MFS transporter [Pseudomonadota bacterium]